LERLFNGETADEAWCVGAKALQGQEFDVQSRNGLTAEIIHCAFVVADPMQKWVVSRVPAINPAFAIAELIWILSGREDADFVNFWNPILPKYSGNDPTYHGAYGARIRPKGRVDQLQRAYDVLRHSPENRQVVIQIWETDRDLPDKNGVAVSRDIPCNICSMVKIRKGRLEWCQVMRSNDLFRGTPHNFFQFMSLQEILAGWLGVELGEYFHVADSLHCYIDAVDDEYGFDEKLRTEMTTTTSIRSNKAEFDSNLSDAIRQFDALRSPDLSKREFNQLVGHILPDSLFGNYTAIAAADSARRRNWPNEENAAIDKCDDRSLCLLWQRWKARNT